MTPPIDGFTFGEKLRNLFFPLKKADEMKVDAENGTGAVSALGEFFKGIKEKLGFIKGIDLGLILGGILSAVVLFKVFRLANMLLNIGNSLKRGIRSIVLAITNNDVKGDITNAFQNVAVAIAAVASAIYLISKNRAR